MVELAPVICVDGPSGSGKGTLAQAIARRLGWHILDSGSLYRIVGLQAHLLGISVEDDNALEQVVKSFDIRFCD